ncbi:hypothetical protein [Sulfurovum sp. NBC37-1]|uniref:hypothetical protein n=1 Tax=Sulfurovum sp. (strain NBC37-1) TaxID=387093 RepID=UPI0001587989|nr:hypothetical protein [Sulfurovum sp. NBC37-1]BAF73248.1 hypothetical protein SUN_2309 [Sulfurovum sp. NBC37-1]
MSILRQNTIFGKFLLDGQCLGVLEKTYLDETTKNIIKKFLKGREPFARSLTAPWTNNQPQWEIEDGKLYLTDIDLSVDMSKSYSVGYEGQKRIEMIGDMNGETRELKVGRTKCISSVDHRSNMQKIFGKDKIFAKWVNEPMRLLVKESKQKSIFINEKTRYETTMELVVLEFEHGILKGRKTKQETFLTVKNHIEDL